MISGLLSLSKRPNFCSIELARLVWRKDLAKNVLFRPY